MKVIRVVFYARVSSEEQAKYGFSVKNQLERLRKYAEENNMLIVEEYVDEGFSAGSKDRPALQRMLKNLHKIDLIIFTKLDRFTRNVLDANEMVKLFIAHDVAIRAIDEEDVDTSTADGMFMFNLKVSLAQREIQKGSERIKTVFEYKINHGQVITGNITFGYKIGIAPDGTKKLVKDPETSHIVEDMFDHFLKYQSVRSTAIYINAKYNVEFVYNTYNRWLKRPMYAGIYRGNENYCEPYISKETHEKILEIMKKNLKVQKRNHIYLFSGLMKCPDCGRNMIGLYSTNRSGTTYHYYRCFHANQSRKCAGKYINETMIEDYLLENINRLIEEYIYKVEVELNEKPKPVIDIKEITDEMDNLNYMFRKKRISQKDYDYEYEILEKRLIEAERMMPEEADLSGLREFLNSGWKNVYRSLDPAEQRAIFRTVIKDIIVDHDGNFTVIFL